MCRQINRPWKLRSRCLGTSVRRRRLAGWLILYSGGLLRFLPGGIRFGRVLARDWSCTELFPSACARQGWESLSRSGYVGLRALRRTEMPLSWRLLVLVLRMGVAGGKGAREGGGRPACRRQGGNLHPIELFAPASLGGLVWGSYLGATARQARTRKPASSSQANLSADRHRRPMLARALALGPGEEQLPRPLLRMLVGQTSPPLP